MPGLAFIGFELPCARGIPATAHVLLYYGSELIGEYAARPGRLLPARSLKRDLRKLLAYCATQINARAAALPLSRRRQAVDMEREHHVWEKRMRREHLTTHHLHLEHTDRFKAFNLPEAARRQLLRQLTTPLDQWPEEQRLRLQLVMPITEDLRLLDKVAVYHHEPASYAVGYWHTFMQDRVVAQMEAVALHVVVQ